MGSYIIKTLAFGRQVRILFLENTEVLRQICDRQNIGSKLKTALGRTLSAACLMSGLLKGKQRISIKVNPSNRDFKIFADADANGNVRGYINDALLNASFEQSDDFSIEELIGENGCIQVLKDLGMNSLFTGITDMPCKNITDDFSHYLNQSEQIPSFLALNCSLDNNNGIRQSRGILAQLLPGAPIELIDEVKTVILENQQLFSSSGNYEEFPGRLFDDISIKEIYPLNFFCGCSREMFYPMLYSLSREELAEAYRNNGQVEMMCHVCGEKYYFSKDELKFILKEM